MKKLLPFFLLIYLLSSLDSHSQICNPNDLYDQIVSDYHSTVAVQSDNGLALWGERKQMNGVAHLLTPTIINSQNFNKLTGNGLKATLGSERYDSQVIVLTTDGIFYWGTSGAVLNATFPVSGKLTIAQSAFGLPPAVMPSDVKIMTAMPKALHILTNEGKVWSLYADSKVWTALATTNGDILENIVQLRASSGGGFVVDSENNWFTWNNEYNGMGKIPISRQASNLAKPFGFSVIPRMIGISAKSTLAFVKQTLFVLHPDGRLYSLGGKDMKNNSIFENLIWEPILDNMQKPLTNIDFISVEEHDDSYPYISAITKDKTLLVWGCVVYNNTAYTYMPYPTIPAGFVVGVDKAVYVESGGHTIIYANETTGRYCYLGHKVNGSMGDNVMVGSFVNSFDCSNTAKIPLCSACPTAQNKIDKDHSTCIDHLPNTLTGNNVLLSDGSPFSYQWQSAPFKNKTVFKDIPLATFQDFEPQKLDDTTLFRRIVRNKVRNCPADSSNLVQISVEKYPFVPIVQVDSIFCENVPFKVVLKNIEPNKAYAFYENDSLIKVFKSQQTSDSLYISFKNTGLNILQIKGVTNVCGEKVLFEKTIQIDKKPDPTLSLKGSDYGCFKDKYELSILNVQKGINYQVFVDHKKYGNELMGDSANLNVLIDQLGVGMHSLSVGAFTKGCLLDTLTEKRYVKINTIKKNLTISNSGQILCSNTDSAIVVLEKTHANVSYHAILNGQLIGKSKTSLEENASLILKISVKELSFGLNTLHLRGSINGCNPEDFSAVAQIQLNEIPQLEKFSIKGDTICSNSDSANVFIFGSKSSEKFTLWSGSKLIANSKAGQEGMVIFSIPRSVLKNGWNRFSAKVSIQGCDSLVLKDSAYVLVNSVSKTNLETFINGPVCLGNKAEVKIYPSEIGKFYEVQKNRSAISESKQGTGDTLKLTVNTTSLQVGEHKLTVGVSVAGCVADTLVSNLKLKINTDPKTDLTVSTNGPVCDGKQAKFYILKPEIGTSYKIFKGQNEITKSVILKNDSLILSLNQLSVGEHVLKAIATNGGCNVIEVGSKQTITVNRFPKTNLETFINGPVCLRNEAEVKIYPSEIGKFYEVQKNRSAISESKQGTGDTLKLTVNTTTLNAGEHKLTVGVSVPGCAADTLVSNLKLKINTDPKTDLSIGTNGPVCDGSQARFFILTPESGTTYMIFEGQNEVTKSAILKNDSLILSLNQLSVGDHVLKAIAINVGCNVAEVGSIQNITVNSTTKTNLETFINGPVCLRNEAEVKIYPSEIGKFYEIRTNNTSISESKLGTGDTLKLTVNTTTLQAGEHKLTVGVSVQGCVADTLVSNLKLKINTDPKIDLSVGTNGPVCDGNQARFFILKPEIGTSYKIFEGQNEITKSAILKNDSLILSLNQLSVGDHVLKAIATNAGCNVAEVGSKQTITVNSTTKTNLETFISGPVCLRNEAEVKIYPSEIGKFYEVQKNRSAISESKQGTGDTLKLTVNTTTLNAGEHKLTVGVSDAGCVADTLVSNLKLKINTDPNTDLTVSTNGPVCDGSQAKFYILKPEIGTTYQIFEGQNEITKSAIFKNDSLILSLNQLSVGDHVLKAIAINAGCNVIEVGSKQTITVNRFPKTNLETFINGPVCLRNEAEVKIYPSEIGKFYEVQKNRSAISESKQGTGDTLKLTVNTTTLNAGEHKLTVGVSDAGCVADTLVSNLKLKINTDPNTDLTVSTNGPVCDGSQAKFYILKPEIGTTYQIFEGQNEITKSAIFKNDSLILSLNQLSVGDHVLKAIAINAGCNVIEVGSKQTITVNRFPKTNLETFINGPVCLRNEAEVKIYPSEIGKFYEVQKNRSAISESKQGTGDTLKLTVNTTTLNAGEHKLTVGVSVPGCAADTLVSNLKLKINTDPKIDLSVGTNGPVCDGNQARFFILKPEIGTSYKIFEGQNEITKSAILKNDSLILSLNQLSVGDHVLKAIATNAGCNVAEVGSKQTITVNSTTKTNLETFISGPVCLRNEAEVKIYPSEIGKFYEVQKNRSAISESKQGTGDTLKLTVNTTTLQVGEHKLTVGVSVAGCVADTLVSNLKLKINTDPKTDLSVGTNGPVCDGSQARFYILKPETGTTYQIFEGQNEITKSTILKGDSLILSLNQLSAGDHELKAKAINAGCNVIEVGSIQTITVNRFPKTNLETFINGPVCLGNEAEVKIYPSEIGKLYQVKRNKLAISDSKLGTGDTLKLKVNTTTLQDGEHKLTVSVSVAGCVADTLVSNLKLKINLEPRADISNVVGSSICLDENSAMVKVLKAQKEIYYQMKFANVDYARLGDDKDLNFDIPKDSLRQGKNEVSFYATSQGCNAVKLEKTANVFLMGSKNAIQGASILCYNSKSDFSIDKTEGALSYNWTVPVEDTIISGQGSNHISVYFGNKESEIKVVPVGTNKACQELESNIKVHLSPQFKGLNFQGTDTVCVGETHSFALDSNFAIGVKTLNWSFSNGIKSETAIDSNTKQVEAKFLQSGVKQIILTPKEACTGLVRKSDTLTIHVMEYPMAEAGEYEVIEYDLQHPIFLNGTGSSEQSVNSNEKYLYNWTSPSLFVQNQHLLVNASFVPVEEETKLYLAVSYVGNQGKGYCEAKDSVVIKIKPIIKVPNVFSPNNDGLHDTWEIPHLNHLFPNCSVEIFNKWGALVFYSVGYNEPWDGTRNGANLPISTYYYIIDLKNGTKPLVKSVAILK